MSDYTPLKRTYGHGSITLTHYPSSGRVGVVQVGTNAVMDTSDLLRFADEAGMLAEVQREAAAEALEQAAVELETTVGRGHQVLRDIRGSHAKWLREVAAAYRRNEGDTE